MAGVPAGDRRRRLEDRRDGQDRRAVLLLQGDPAAAPAAARVGAAGRAWTSATRTSCPVDWVASALEHIAHEPDLDGQAFHLTDPRPQRVDELINELADSRARAAVRGQHRQTAGRRVAEVAAGAGAGAAAVRQVAEPGAARAGDPGGGARAHGARATLRHARSRQRAGGLAAASSRRRCTTTPRGCGTTGSARWTRASARGARCARRSAGEHVMITGASSGIGRATALKVAAAGGVPLLVARNVEKLEEVRAEIVAAGGTAYVYAADIVRHGVGRTAARAGARRPPQRGHARQQRRPLDPALDRAQLRPLPRLRTHDAAQLLRRGQADHRAAAAHARARLAGTS